MATAIQYSSPNSSDELARADHLCDQVEGHDHQRARCRKGADRPLLEAVARHVGKRELAQVAQALGHQEGDDGPAHQEADGIDQSVIAEAMTAAEIPRNEAADVVAGNGQAVLETGDAAAGGVEVGRRLGLGCGPLGDPERAQHKEAEHGDGRPVRGCFTAWPRSAPAACAAAVAASRDSSASARPRVLMRAFISSRLSGCLGSGCRIRRWRGARRCR